jgi:hypothetical protein
LSPSRRPPGVESAPVHDAISDYGVGRYRAYFWAQLFAGSTACIGVAVALANLHTYVPAFVVAMLLANAAVRFLLPAFPTDQSGNRFETGKGTIHMILAIVAFAAVAVAASSWGGLFSHYVKWHRIKGPMVTLGWVVVAGAAATGLALVGPRLKRILGLIERLFTLSVIAWLYVMSIEVIRFGK